MSTIIITKRKEREGSSQSPLRSLTELISLNISRNFFAQLCVISALFAFNSL
ncbi:MAG: hypothetical protein JST55_09205 [Bacteroidetes bacterium]|nr:hypothetical protein [Bacteroidota bacterium]